MSSPKGLSASARERFASLLLTLAANFVYIRNVDGVSVSVSDYVCREVFKAKHRQTGKKVALKKVLMENEKEGVSRQR